LNPNLAAERSGYAYFLSTQKRHEQALTEIKKSRELDPLAVSYRANIGHILYFARQYDQSIEQLKQTLELDRNYEYSHVVLGYVYAASGRYAEALAEYKETSRLGGETTSLQCYLGYALAKSGQQPAAEAILKRLETNKEYVSPAELAILYDGLGHTEKALSALEQAYTAHDVQLQFLTADPHYDGLHAEPRFVNLLQKVGLLQ
jgi:tetratricopeptide (TPR) repeat protein